MNGTDVTDNRKLSLPLKQIQLKEPAATPLTPDSDYDDLPCIMVPHDQEGNPHFSLEDSRGSRKHANVRQTKSFYEVVYKDDPIPLRSNQRKGFISGLSLDVKITQMERTLGHKFNPILYTIEVKHGDNFHWALRRRYHHFRKLHTSLLVFRTGQAMFGGTSTSSGQSQTKREEQYEYESKAGDTETTQTTPCRTPSSENDVKMTSFEEKEEIQRPKGVNNKVGPLGTGDSPKTEAAGKQLAVKQSKPSKANLPRFPKRPDSLLHPEDMERRRNQLEKYLRAVLSIEGYRNHPETLDFFEVSEYSFMCSTAKRKEGLVKKRTGDSNLHGWLRWKAMRHFKDNCCCNCVRNRWKKTWLVIQETCILGLSPKTGEVRTVLLLDKDFEVSSGYRLTHNKNSILLSNSSRAFCFRTWTHRKQKEWMEEIQAVITGQPAKCFLQSNRFGSFAPVRNDQVGHWFVDGQSFMSAVADVIMEAKEEIFITDWWLSPEIFLKRGLDFTPALRLDLLLQRKAEEGVKIFILLYKEFQLALGLNSFYTKRALLTKCGKNIKIFRHPDHSGTDMKDYLWAHHEKLVVIDQSYAFVGGIDLCYGRWDTNSHPLTDVDVMDNARVCDLNSSSGLPMLSMIPNTSSRSAKRQGATMVLAQVLKAAHEVSVAPVRSLSFDDRVQPEDENTQEAHDDHDGDKGQSRVSRLKTAMSRARRKLKRRKSSEEDSDECFSDEDIDDKAGIENTVSLSDEKLDEAGKFDNPDLATEFGPMTLWKGKDYVNFIVKDVARPEEPEGDNVDRRTTPRMPWHDIAVMVQGAAARDVARHFIQRWNAIKAEKAKFKSSYPFLIPRPYEGIYDLPRVLNNHKSSNVHCQVLRSASEWSAGIDDTESSIYTAMIKAIEEAEHFIYIENQFFITSCGNVTVRDVKNEVGLALLDRIKKAHRSNEKFRVFVMLPLLPAFEGKIGSATGNALRVILHYNYSSIIRGDASIWSMLERSGINPMNYICFCSLRTKGELLNTPVTELIYIHSKLMIVDDRLVICGSANINDRSLLGNRDSEVCLHIQDTEFTNGFMDGKPSKSGKFAGTLRRFLMAEHLGLFSESTEERSSLEAMVGDPICDSFYKDLWLKTASLNSKIFDDAFLVVPTDNVKTLDECNQYEHRTPLAEFDKVAANRMLKEVKGSLVLLPLKFLQNENLAPPVFAKEGMVPSITWT